MRSYLNPCIVQAGGWGHPQERISFCGDPGARRGWKAAGSRRAALPRAGCAAGGGAGSAGSPGSAELQQSPTEGGGVPWAMARGHAAPGAAARRCGDTQQPPGGAPAAAEGAYSHCGKQDGISRGHFAQEKTFCISEQILSPQNHSWQRLSFLPGLPQPAAN